MQERKKKKIVLASVLKPVDEPRMFGKMALSLAKAGHSVFVFGVGNPPSSQAVHCFPHPPIKRISLKRLFLPWYMIRQWFLLKPDALIVCTHELLLPALIYKTLRSVKLIYDVQENYYLNILHTNAFYYWLRFLVACYVRMKEKITGHWVDHLILAEQVYAHQLAFIKKRYVIIENKVKVLPKPPAQKDHAYFHWLFTGTLAESTGVFKAIALAKEVHAMDNRFTLTICGFAPQQACQWRLRKEENSFIKLIGIETPVSHDIIQKHIQEADLGFLYYPASAHIQGRIPTKYYEYSSWQLPILTFSDQSIAQEVIRWGLGWVLTGKEYAPEILEILQKRPVRSSLPSDHFWPAAEKTLLAIVE